MDKLDFKLFIAKLYPAEILFLVRPNGIQEEDFIRYTLADLILKKILSINVETRKPHPKDPIKKTYIEIGRGPNFNFYKPQIFEEVFLTQISEGKVMFLNNYLRIISVEIPLLKTLKKQIISEDLSQLLNQSVLSKVSGIYKLNEYGLALKTAIINLMEDSCLRIPRLYNQPDDLFELIEYLGGNIFFVKTVDQHVWNSICSSIAKRTKDNKLNLNNQNLMFLDESYYQPEIFRLISIFFFNMDKFFLSDDEFRNENIDMDWSWVLDF